MNTNPFKILIVDDEIDYTNILKKILMLEDFDIDTVSSGEDALKYLKFKPYNLVLTDLMMEGMDGIELTEKIKDNYPEAKVILMTAYATIDNAVRAMKKGADSYFVKGNDPHDLIKEIRVFARKNNHSSDQNSTIYMPSNNSTYKRVLEKAKKAANSNLSILLLGESGVGKEVFAKYIHQMSQRSEGDFVPVNCHALQDSVLESELFGHCKGAFTGADQDRIGRFESANGGTLFLDEIADTPLSTQVKLLRTLDSKKIERMGSSQSIDVDFRLITATNKDIQKLIASEEFREDFYYRISTVVLTIPSLRERPEDILDLVDHFVESSAKELNVSVPSIPEDVKQALYHYDYPGNIRELKNIIDHLVLFSDNDSLSIDELPKRVTSSISQSKKLKSVRDAAEKQHIKKVLLENDNKMEKSAEVLGITRRQLTNKVKDLKIEK